MRLLTLVFALALTLESASAAAAQRPNILLIMPDQMRASAMGCDGNPDVKTPHIDRLATDGVRFKRTYADTPVCCPARAVLLTGTYCHVNGMIANDLRLREEQVTLAEILRDAGYRTGFVGKWHLDGGPRDPGFVPPGPRRMELQFPRPCRRRWPSLPPRHVLHARRIPRLGESQSRQSQVNSNGYWLFCFLDAPRFDVNG